MADINLVLQYENGNLKVVSKEAETTLKNSAKKGTKEYKKEGTKGGKKFSEGLKSGLKSASVNIAKIGAAAAAAVAASGVVFAAKSVKLAAVQEDAVNRLNSALSITGKLTAETSAELQAFASSLQEASRFGDETILSASALIQSLGNLEKDALKGATQAALDLAAALKIDLRSAAVLVGKAATGEVSSFSRYGVAIKKGKDNAETFSNTLTELNKKFGGAAAKDVNTYSGAVDQASNSFGDLLEKFGDAIIKNPVVLKGLKERAALFTRLGDQFEKFRTGGGLAKALVEIVEISGKVGIAINDFMIRPLEVLFNVGKTVIFGLNFLMAGLRQGILSAALSLENFTGAFSFLSRISGVVLNSIQVGLGFIATGLVALGQKLVGFIGLFTDVSKLEAKLEGFSDSLVEGVIENSKEFKKELDDLVNNTNERKATIKTNLEVAADFNKESLDSSIVGLNESLENILSQNVSDTIAEKVASLKASLVDLANGVGETTRVQTETTLDAVRLQTADMGTFFGQVGENFEATKVKVGETTDEFNKRIEQGNKSVKDFAKQTSDSLKQGIAQGAGNAFAAFGAALANGENALEAFGAAFLKQIANMAIQQGTAFILQGIGYQFVPGFQAIGGSLIAAGASLAVFGGALGALVGGGSKGGATAGAGGGGGSTGGSLSDGDTIDEGFVGEERVQAQASTVLNINVEGNVVDQDAFTRQLVENISDEGGKQGLTFNNFSTV